MTRYTYRKARKILDGIETITRNEMLTQRVYVSGLERPDLAEAGAICGGRKACLIGSAWLAAGIGIEEGTLRNVEQGARWEEFERNPALKVAYDALNRAAGNRIDWYRFEESSFESAAEHYFETELEFASDDEIAEQVLSLLDDARFELERAYDLTREVAAV